MNELPIPLPAGYTAELKETITEPLSPSGAPIGLDVESYRINLYKNGQLKDILTTSDTSADLRRAVKEHIIDTEPEGPEKAYLLRFFDPSFAPPWERKTMTRGQLPTPEALLNSLNDEGNAVRFEKEAARYLRYDATRGEWFAWIDNHWEPAKEKIGQVLRLVGKSTEEELNYWKRRAEIENTPEMRNLVTQLQNHVNLSKNHTKQVALRKMIEGSSMQVNLAEASDDRYITFKNGAIDCKTGEIIPIWACDSIREKYPLIYLDRTYTPGLRSQAFIDHLKAVFTDNTSDLTEDERTLRMMELGRCFLRLLGYLLYPANPEQIILFLWGKGSNGKSTTIDVLRDIFGSEMSEASVRELYAGFEDRPASGIYRSLSKRAMLISEASDEESRGGRISADTVKALTGDAVTSRFRDMYEKSRPQKIVCTPVGVTNELPRFDKVLDFALLRRIFTIPFPHLFAGDERVRDIRESLLAEGDAIFSMVVDELIAYINEGLLPVPAFCAATQNELLAGFEVSAFIEECVERSETGKVSRLELEEAYIAWCARHDIPVGLAKIQMPGYDEYSQVNFRQGLSEKEKRGLFKGMRVYGFEEKTVRGTRFFSCVLKK
ncbi:MAG: hypothetical protein Q7J08_03405 [Methanocorpusculum sp.]|uniref:hypothetical protein n=1 Tax=Methanocorpusculum sp. TaxID=2058474 RepID=UPI00271A33B2|nr:hypothetical protein [Methanocorpusculum sp.]MDO9522741.1 hypothetical protein [Methanocorpusculum sp.]